MNPRPSTVLNQNRELIRRVVLCHRTRNPRVFGSIIRGTDTEFSDLDLLVDPYPAQLCSILAHSRWNWKRLLGFLSMY